MLPFSDDLSFYKTFQYLGKLLDVRTEMIHRVIKPPSQPCTNAGAVKPALKVVLNFTCISHKLESILLVTTL